MAETKTRERQEIASIKLAVDDLSTSVELLDRKIDHAVMFMRDLGEQHMRRLTGFKEELQQGLQDEKGHELKATIERARFCGEAAAECRTVLQRCRQILARLQAE